MISTISSHKCKIGKFLMKLLDLLLPTVLVKPGVNMWVFKASSELDCTVFF